MAGSIAPTNAYTPCPTCGHQAHLHCSVAGHTCHHPVCSCAVDATAI